MATDTGTNTTMRLRCDSVKNRGTDLLSRARTGQNSSQSKESVAGENKSGRLEGNKLQVCHCGWKIVRKIVKEVSDEAVKSSQWIWIRRSSSSWGPSRGST